METTSAPVKNNISDDADICDDIDDDDDKNNNYPIVTFIRGALSSCRVARSSPQHNPPFHPFSLHPRHPPTGQIFLQFKDIQRPKDGRPSRLDHGQGRQAGVGHLRPGLAPPPDGRCRGRQGRVQVRLGWEPVSLFAQELFQVRTPGEAGCQRHHSLH